MRPTNEPAFLNPLIALLTDFGQSDHYVGVVKGVIASIAPLARVVDISHEVKPHAVREASYLLWASYRFFPSNSIFVPIVDPGVGGRRRIIAARTEKHFFVAPDNGVLQLVGAEEPFVECREVKTDNSPFILSPVSATFQGRDVLAPVAAYLASGVPCSEFGPACEVPRSDVPFAASISHRTGYVLHCDRFGNIVTNIRNEMFESIAAIRIKRSVVAEKIRFYQEGKMNLPSLIRGSSGLVEIVMKEGSASGRLGVQPETSFRIEWR